MNNRKIITKSLVVHSGKFHADDVVATALLVVCDLVDMDKITRTRDPQIIQQAEFVCDVGGVHNEEFKRFDHHQKSYTGYKASAGLVVDFLEANDIMSKLEASFLRKIFIDNVDAHDTGRFSRKKESFSSIIENFYVPYNKISSDELNIQFIEAVKFTHGFIKRALDKFRLVNNYTKPLIVQALKNSGDNIYIEIPSRIDWISSFFDQPKEDTENIYFALSVDERNLWSIRCIPKKLGSFTVKKPFPKKWSGLNGEELSGVSGILGGVFCHKEAFISVWKTRDSAIQAMNVSMTHCGDSCGIS